MESIRYGEVEDRLRDCGTIVEKLQQIGTGVSGLIVLTALCLVSSFSSCANSMNAKKLLTKQDTAIEELRSNIQETHDNVKDVRARVYGPLTAATATSGDSKITTKLREPLEIKLDDVAPVMPAYTLAECEAAAIELLNHNSKLLAVSYLPLDRTNLSVSEEDWSRANASLQYLSEQPKNSMADMRLVLSYLVTLQLFAADSQTRASYADSKQPAVFVVAQPFSRALRHKISVEGMGSAEMLSVRRIPGSSFELLKIDIDRMLRNKQHEVAGWRLVD